MDNEEEKKSKIFNSIHINKKDKKRKKRRKKDSKKDREWIRNNSQGLFQYFFIT